jgi:hypothetical protein
MTIANSLPQTCPALEKSLAEQGLMQVLDLDVTARRHTREPERQGEAD